MSCTIRTTLFVSISILLLCVEDSRAQTLLKNFPSTDGFVSAIAFSGDTAYLGGTFSYVGPSTGNCVLLDAATGTVNTSFPSFTGFYEHGDVNTVAQDRNAGVYQQAVLDGSRFASGTYVARLQFGGKQLLRKMLLMK